MSRNSSLTVAWPSTPHPRPSAFPGRGGPQGCGLQGPWAPQSQGQGPRGQVYALIGDSPSGAPCPDEVRDVAAGLWGFPNGEPPLGCQGPERPVAASCQPRPSDQRWPWAVRALRAAGRHLAQLRAIAGSVQGPYSRESAHTSHPTRALPCERIQHSANRAPVSGPRGRPHSFPRSLGTQPRAPPGREQFPEARPTSGHEASLAGLASGRSTQVCRSARSEPWPRDPSSEGKGRALSSRRRSPAREPGLCGVKVYGRLDRRLAHSAGTPGPRRRSALAVCGPGSAQQASWEWARRGCGPSSPRLR